jgi:hypothetical protein
MLFTNFLKVLIVDDGSTDRTSKVAFEYVKKHNIDNVRVLLLGRNHGKGEAVRKVSVEVPVRCNNCNKSTLIIDAFQLFVEALSRGCSIHVGNYYSCLMLMVQLKSLIWQNLKLRSVISKIK